MEKEYCCECDEETGRAGKCEDSLYLYTIAGNEWGPLCEVCYQSHDGRNGWHSNPPYETE